MTIDVETRNSALACPICRTASNEERSFEDVSLWRCPECDHCFTNQSRLKNLEEYDDTYYDKTHSNWFLYPNYSLFDRIRRRIKKLGITASVIDVGCGRGQFLKYIREREPHFRLTGIDVSPVPPEDQILFRRGDFLTYEFKETFDAVVSLSTIEHVPDVQLFVKRLGQLCRPGGMVFIMTPNDRSLLYEAARPLFALGVRAPFERLYSRHHLHHFNKTSLKRLMEQHGLPIDERFDHNIPLAAVDIPPVSRVQRAIFFLGVIVTFAFGKLTGRTYLQTLVCGRRAY